MSGIWHLCRWPQRVYTSKFAISPTIYRALKPGFPKIAEETAAETQGAGEESQCWGTAAETVGGTALALRSKEKQHSPIAQLAILLHAMPRR